MHPQGGPEGPPSWAPQQQQWAGGAPPPPPPAPPSKGGKGKWILVGLALVAVIALSVVGTVLVLRPSESGGGGGDNPPSTVTATAQNGNSEFASANDKGPVKLITEDPSCAAWIKIAQEYSNQLEVVGWADRNTATPSAAWSPEQQAMYKAAENAISSATRQTSNLVKITPHRVMRELYGQFIAYGQTFVSVIPNYVENDVFLSATTDGISSALSGVCSAIESGSVQRIAPMIPDTDAPTTLAPIDAAEIPERFLVKTNSICPQWTSEVEKFDADTAAWRGTDPAKPATDWTPEVKAINDAVVPIMIAHAQASLNLGRESENATLEDIATLASLYQRAFAEVLPEYVTSDFYLSRAAAFLSASINTACKAAG